MSMRFIEIVVEYPEDCPEYKGKPYFSILYDEDGELFEGFGTYKPEVLSEYIREYFMGADGVERKKGKWIKMSDADGIYYACSECGKEISRVPHFNPQFDSFPRLKSLEKTNFCPNCGADMRGEKDG